MIHPRHDMMDMTMPSSSMDMSGMASSTSMSMASSTGMDHMDHLGHMGGGMHHMDMHGGMTMYFSTFYANRDVLFKNFKASNNGQAFGMFVLIFVAGFVGKSFEFIKNYLEVRVWNNPNYQRLTTIIDECNCDDDDDEKAKTPVETNHTPRAHSLMTSVVREIIRLSLCFLSSMLSYALMLVAMTFSLVYFFAAVLGDSVGRYFFERLSDILKITPLNSSLLGHH